jgi:hypothetical protein
MTRAVREPIQVYLSAEERAELDAAARSIGVSRSEMLRRGIASAGGAMYTGALRDLVDAGYMTPASTPAGAPPPSAPVASLRKILTQLEADRGET